MIRRWFWGIFSILLLVLAVAVWFWFRPGLQTPVGNAPPVSHALWDSLLHHYVDADGWVNYHDWKRDTDDLQVYLDLLSANPPAQNWSDLEKLAYWINAYNAFTVQVIMEHYPLQSIQDLHPPVYVPFVSSVWQKKFFRIGGQPFWLDRIEHQILRRQFDEPRIHFAINCASVSCPVLRNEAYTAEKLEFQLSEQTQRFLTDTTKNIVEKDRLVLSRIFQWFGGDFTQEGRLVDFLNQFTPVEIATNAEISWMDYDWNLNEIAVDKREIFEER